VTLVPLRAVLFDLDGTLLDNDMDVFITHFLRRFAPHVAHRVSPEALVQAWLYALQLMQGNADPALTNQEVFDLHFYPRIDALRDELLPSVQAFYATSYRSLRSLARPRPGARETVEAMLDAGMQVVVATNPIFPQTAVEQRLEWAGVAGLPFSLVTHSENMHAAKPSLQYYQEILRRIECTAAECLMVGDDFINDIQPTARLGIRTYWVNTNTTTPPNFDPRSRGELHHFYIWLVATGLLTEQA
jgi:HAD superfamily hydrolase (TIGR01662 family)